MGGFPDTWIDLKWLLVTSLVMFSFFKAMYGVLSGLEGLDMHNDLLTHTSIKPWYNRVKEAVQSHAGALGAQKKH